jgi:hypothetical protein
MNLQELKTKLRELGIRDDAYLLGSGVGAMDNYVLEPNGNEWIVYYEERGKKNGLRRFATEAAACEHLLQWLLRDPTTHERPLRR